MPEAPFPLQKKRGKKKQAHTYTTTTAAAATTTTNLKLSHALKSFGCPENDLEL